MDTVTVESIPIVVGRGEDGRWWADIESMPGVMAYGDTRDLAIAAVRALALRVAADCIDHGEMFPGLSRRSSLFHEPMAVGQGEATFGCVAPHRMDRSLAEWLAQLRRPGGQLHIRVSRRRRGWSWPSGTDREENRAAT
jgi:predicted RNase H-like HicB family nuclease